MKAIYLGAVITIWQEMSKKIMRENAREKKLSTKWSSKGYDDPFLNFLLLSVVA